MREILCLADSGVMDKAVATVENHFGRAPKEILSFRQLRQRPRLALCLPLQRFDVALVMLADVDAPLYRDFILSYLFFLRAKRKILCDVQGKQVPVGFREGLMALGRCFKDLVAFPAVYGCGRWRAKRLRRRGRQRRIFHPSCRRVAYLRANLWQESKAGGSVAHTVGVLTGLKSARMDVTYVGTADFPPVRRLAVDVVVVPARLRWMRNLPDLPFVAYSESFARHCGRLFLANPPDFVYQRYSVFNFAGAWLAQRFRCAFVLEYNGSEVWVARHWGARLFFEQLADRIEMANLVSADLIVVVSGALRDELLARGIPSERILVNPNGVDPDRYSPACDGAPVRGRSGLEAKVVIGFIGTFGPWHGAEVLARAIRPVVERLPQAHFLFVGDGSRMAAVREIVVRDGVEWCVTFTGLVPQDEAPAYLAACDILVSPHVPNADGSRFFGSPTKLFEYMAMGKGIVASDLEQIGEVLTHDRTAWLVRPGDVEDLVAGIVVLGSNPELRARLGAAARAEAVERYTWDAHVRRMLGRMDELGLLAPQGNLP